MRTAGLLQRLGARLPIVAAPMAGGPSTLPLVKAASQAGGLGFLAAGYQSAEQLDHQMKQARRSGSRFGVNLFAPPPVPVDPLEFARYAEALRPWASAYAVPLGQVAPREDDDQWDEKIHMLLKSPADVVSFTFGLPSAEVISALHRAGAITLQTVTSRTEAQQAQDAGVDGLIVQSSQAGGHSGTWTPAVMASETTTPELVRHIRGTVSLPVWGAGGISTPRAVTDTLDAGAEAAVVGTVLLRTHEAGTSAVHRGALAQPPSPETVITRAFSGRAARALRNRFTDEFTASAPLGFPALHYLTAPIRQAAAAAGDPHGVNLWAGTGYAGAKAEPAATTFARLTDTCTGQ